MRTFAPVIVRGEENEGVKFWGFGKMVYQELLSVIADPDYGDITDPMTGRDVVVEFISAEDTGKSFPTTNVRVKPNQTPITEDKALLETTLDNQSDITEVYKELSYDDLTEVLNTWLSDTPEDGEEKADEKNEVVSKATVTDTTEAFDALFNR